MNNLIKKYFFIIVVWVFTILVLIFWGSLRYFMIIPAIMTSLGYYFLVKGIEGKKAARDMKFINSISSENIPEGLVRVEGKIYENDKLVSPIEKKDVVFYDIVIEQGLADYDKIAKFNPDNADNDLQNEMNKAKWNVIAREIEWKPFFIVDNNFSENTNLDSGDVNNQSRIFVENPGSAEGNWVYTKDNLPKMSISTVEEADEPIQKIIKRSMEKKNKQIESNRYIRFMERTIENGNNIIAIGSIEKINDKEYKIKRGKDGHFIITNDDEYDFEYEERKDYIKGMIIFIFGIVSLIISFLYPYIIKAAESIKI